MTVIQDDRTPAQRLTHTLLVVGTDKGMSGWGKAEGGVSLAAWACRPEHVNAVESTVEQRGDMSRVRVVVADEYRPSPRCAHLHIYVARA